MEGWGEDKSWERRAGQYRIFIVEAAQLEAPRVLSTADDQGRFEPRR